MCGQSAANAAGSVSPMMKPKNRPDGVAPSPGSAATRVRHHHRWVGRAGPGSGPSRLPISSSADAVAFIFRFGIPSG